MAVIKCKMCGGDLALIEGQSVAECEYCGSRQTVPTADNEKKLTLFARANRLRFACEFDKAAGIYETIVADFPEEAEAYWGLVLCKYGIEYVDDPATGKKIPTCHRSSFESVMDDDNFDQAQENADALASRVYREEAKQIEEIRKGIVAVSGNEKPYDIFICYKETDSSGDRTLDSVLAQDVYDALTAKGYRTFFARITLEDKLGQEYEPYIFAALNSAKIMLAVGTCYEHYNAVWVKNEWSRYLKLMTTDKSKHLIPCYKGLDAYDIPKEFARLQAQDLGKMGAIQDILRGVEKLLPRQMDTAVIPERMVVSSDVGAVGNNRIASLLDRGNMALEDSDWAKADSFFEDVLNNDSKNAQAYLGKTLAQERCRTMDELVSKRKNAYPTAQSEKLYIKERKAHISERAEQYSLPGYVDDEAIRNLYRFNLGYTSEVSGREKQCREEEAWWQSHQWLSRAEKFAVGAVAETIQNEKKHLFAQLNDRVKKAREADERAVSGLEAAYDAHIAEADSKAEQMHNDGLSRKEKDYQSWLEQAKAETNPATLDNLAKNFDKLGDYKDSKHLAQHCRKRAAEEQEKIDAENERQQELRAQQERARKAKMKKRGILTAIAAAVSIALMILVTKVIIPGNQYKKAEELLAAGDTYGAAKTFGAAGSYRDSWNRSFELWGTITQRATIEAGGNHTVALREDGSVVAAGSNFYGQSGVSAWEDVVDIAAGSFHTVGLKADGTVVAVGYNDDGQCGVSGWTDIVAVSAGNDHTVGLKVDGTVVAVGYNYYGQCDVSGWTDIVAVSAGGNHTVGLKADGTVVAVGHNEDGQCGVSGWTDIVAISAGGNHTVGLKADGTVVAVGEKNYGECDVSGWRDIVAISAGGSHTIGLKTDGTAVAVGWNRYCQCDISDWKNIVAIDAGVGYTVGLKTDGTVVAVGYNGAGQCNVSGWTDIKLPAGGAERKAAMDVAEAERKAAMDVAEAERLTAEYAAAEALEAEGLGAQAALAFYALGDYQDARERSFALWDQITQRETISTGLQHTVALNEDGTVKAVGSNQFGQCNVSGWTDIVAISAGERHTVGLRDDGTVVAAGDNGSGQCDVGDWTDIVEIRAVGWHTVGLRGDGTVVAAGYNKNGQCEVGDWTDIVAISAVGFHTVGLHSDGTVVVVGDNTKGQCEVSGWTDIIAICTGDYHTIGLRSDGTVVAAGDNEYGQCEVSSWTDIVAISAGTTHTVGLRSDGTVAAAGDNEYGQCEVSSWTDIVAICAGGIHTVGLRNDGTVVAVGYNDDNRCQVSGWSNIVEIRAGYWHTAGLCGDGTVVAVGNNKDFQCEVSKWSNILVP